MTILLAERALSKQFLFILHELWVSETSDSNY
jgi:hypothetical protein